MSAIRLHWILYQLHENSRKSSCRYNTVASKENKILKMKKETKRNSHKAGFHMIADDRGTQIAESSAIVCDHMETHFCDRLRSCDRDRRRSQKIEPCSIFCDRCDRLRSCDHMETKVLRSAIEMYPIIFLILTDNSTFPGHEARMFDYSNAYLL